MVNFLEFFKKHFFLVFDLLHDLEAIFLPNFYMEIFSEI